MPAPWHDHRARCSSSSTATSFINSEPTSTRSSGTSRASRPRRTSVRIEVNAHQWAWDVRYAGPTASSTPQDDIVTLNDIRVPVGAPVLFQLASTDVIHSFYLPELPRQADAVPGMINRMWFQAQETGDFDIGCAQHCGVNHYKMKAPAHRAARPRSTRPGRPKRSRDGTRGYDAERQGSPLGLGLEEHRDMTQPMAATNLSTSTRSRPRSSRSTSSRSTTRSSPSSSSGPGLLFLAFGGTLAMLIRWQWAFPGQPVPVVGRCSSPSSGGSITPADVHTASSRCTASS